LTGRKEKKNAKVNQSNKKRDFGSKTGKKKKMRGKKGQPRGARKPETKTGAGPLLFT